MMFFVFFSDTLCMLNTYHIMRIFRFTVSVHLYHMITIVNAEERGNTTQNIVNQLEDYTIIVKKNTVGK